MGALAPISLGVRSNPHRRNKQAGNARLVNCFSEELGGEGKSQWTITATPGLKTFGSPLTGGGIRAMLPLDNQLIAVVGKNVFSVNASGAASLRGGIPTTGPVYMRRNRRVPVQVGIVSDGYYAVLEGNAVTEVQDVDLPPPTSLAYLDGYGILPISRGRFMITGIDDFTTIDGLDEGVAESNPDEIVRAHELEREVFLFGPSSLEAHQNTGDEDFPFTRSQASEIGCLAGGSVARIDTPTSPTLVWVAHDHTVRMLHGYQGAVISTGEIEELIRRLADEGRTGELRATSWSAAGRFFYSLSCDDWTRVFEAKSGAWHDRRSYLSKRWRISDVVTFAGKTICGDHETGQLYEMSDDLHDEAGSPHVMEIVTPPVNAFPYAVRHNALYVDVATGVGLNTTVSHDKNPVMLVDWSEDGGVTWGPAREIALGQLAKSPVSTSLRMLGKSGPKGRVYRFRISAAVEKLVMSASLDTDLLAAA